jgi:RNA polymerase sigma-70 factor (ECF subfamily)
MGHIIENAVHTVPPTTAATVRPVAEADPRPELELRLEFEDLYRASFPGLIGVATALTGDAHEAQDLVQETMVKAFVRWRYVSRLSAPLGWCHRVLSNSCRSWWRRRRTEERYRPMLARRLADASGPSPDVVAFWAATRLLPARPRMVVALHFAGDRTLAEVAAILGVPEGTVRSDLARARSVVMAALDGER